MNEIAGMEFEIEKKSIRIADLEQNIEDLKTEFQNKEAAMNQKFAETLFSKRLEWDVAMKTREKELTLQAANSLAANEEKHALILAENTANHKKQVEDLRTFYSVSTSNAKKEAEAQRLRDLEAQQMVQENVVLRLTTMHESAMIAEKNRLTDINTNEIEKLTNEYEEELADLRADYQKLDDKKIDLEEKMLALKELKDNLETIATEKAQELHKRDKELKRKT
jgi:chromosome segregation ATPase